VTQHFEVILQSLLEFGGLAMSLKAIVDLVV